MLLLQDEKEKNTAHVEVTYANNQNPFRREQKTLSIVKSARKQKRDAMAEKKFKIRI